MPELLACFAIFQAISTRIPTFSSVYASSKLSFSNSQCLLISFYHNYKCGLPKVLYIWERAYKHLIHIILIASYYRREQTLIFPAAFYLSKIKPCIVK